MAEGKTTADGRPLLWKIRDNSSAPNNKEFFNTRGDYKYKFITVVTANVTTNSPVWMGVDEC